MLPRPNRLRRAADITRTYRRGTYGSGGGLVSAKVAPSGRAEARVVVVVAKKIDKRAVVRNRIRRRLIEMVRELMPGIRPGCDIVISVHQNVAETPASELQHQLSSALARSGAIAK